MIKCKSGLFRLFLYFYGTVFEGIGFYLCSFLGLKYDIFKMDSVNRDRIIYNFYITWHISFGYKILSS